MLAHRAVCALGPSVRLLHRRRQRCRRCRSPILHHRRREYPHQLHVAARVGAHLARSLHRRSAASQAAVAVASVRRTRRHHRHRLTQYFLHGLSAHVKAGVMITPITGGCGEAMDGGPSVCSWSTASVHVPFALHVSLLHLLSHTLMTSHQAPARDGAHPTPSQRTRSAALRVAVGAASAKAAAEYWQLRRRRFERWRSNIT